ncbi:universal stress protein [Prosthecobacter sp.]|uniref:universal stress protein n=1 Tax=Prosthecobacter sp. TaxID=1965333 RepID=UPI003782D958
MNTVLALIDFSDVSSKVLEHARTLAKAFESEVILVHVVPPEPLVVDFEPPAVPPDVFEARQKELSIMRDALAKEGVHASAQVFGGLLQVTLLEQIGRIDPDVIVMGSHGHGSLYHLIVGSVTEGIIRNAQRPVVIIPSVPAPQARVLKVAEADAPAEEAALGVPLPA